MSRDANPAAPRLRIGTLLAYALPGLPLGFLGTALLVFLPSFYANEMGLGLVAAGFVLSVARIWDIVLGPFVGALVDGVETRFGTRRPWLLVGLVLVVVAAPMLFLPPSGAGAVHLLLWAAALYAGLWFIELPHLAWGAELSANYGDRVRLMGWRAVFLLLGTIVIAALPLLLWSMPGGLAEEAGSAAMKALFWIGVGLTPLSLAVLCGAVPAAPRLATRRQPVFRGLAAVVRNRLFRWFLGAAFIVALANALQASLFLLFVDHVLGLRGMAGPLLLTYFGAAALSIPVWTTLSVRIGKHRAWAVAMILAAGAVVLLPFLGSGAFAFFLFVCLATGASFGADLCLAPAMLADILDLDTLRSGEQRGARYYGVWASAGRFAMALALGLAFPALAAANFSPQSEVAGGAGLWALTALFGPMPMLLKLLAAGIIWRYPLGASVQADARRRIEARAGGAGQRENTVRQAAPRIGMPRRRRRVVRKKPASSA